VVRSGEEVVIVIGSDREREERLSRREEDTAWIFFVGLGMVGDSWMVVQPRKRVASQLKVEIGWPVRGRGCW